MSRKAMKVICAAMYVGAFAAAADVASAAMVITEVDPYGSNSGDGYAADWFEVTNTGSTAVSIAGWSMVDNHAASNSTTPYAAGATVSIGNLSGGNATFGPALLTLAGSSQSIGAGQSAIFLESSAGASTSSALISSFESAWFGTNVPGNLLVGTYNDGTNYGLSQTADMVNLFSGNSASSSLLASVAFGADGGTPVSTFDNAQGLNNSTLTQKSVAGVNGAFVSANGIELGSPGSISPVPLPGSLGLLLSGLSAFGLLGFLKRKSPPAASETTFSSVLVST
jgi:Lamin Tail Domain